MKTVHDIIVKPIITEDSMARTADKKYTFEVMSGATKPEIAKAVDTEHFTKICRSRLRDNMSVELGWRSVRPIPERDDWFETVWKKYREKNVNSPAK